MLKFVQRCGADSLLITTLSENMTVRNMGILLYNTDSDYILLKLREKAREYST